jgi:hypothetical protein
MNIYVQPTEGNFADRPRMPKDGPVVEHDPTFARLRAANPDPGRLLGLSISALRDELLVWGDIRIGERDLFGNWSGDYGLPGYPVGLVRFALDMGWMRGHAVTDGWIDDDPSAGGAMLVVRYDGGDKLVVSSMDIEERFEVPLGEAWTAVHGLGGRVRAFLLSLDRRFMDHPELGAWVRGDVMFP